MARLWWGGKCEEMHWISWEKMCEPKCTGGMSFKDLDVLNDALLGKQFWRLLHHKNSLLSRVMSFKYYPHDDIFEARLDYSNNYARRSIWSAKSMVKEGLIWRVGNGKEIDLWSAICVRYEERRFIKSERVEELNVVGDLIDEERKEWYATILEQYFNERDQRCINPFELKRCTR